ncbi:hypothetical protein [Thermophilibacter mediterraneus]|uniref:phage NrS-1 polymerase family protein n=1 Tax=Thermophilibacter mediterraneus TaxID=1871031 RepID=UPI003D188745
MATRPPRAETARRRTWRSAATWRSGARATRRGWTGSSRRSGLMRDKWDSRRGGTTYGAQTIERAISSATEFYQPRAKGKRGRRSLPN